jgi:hypothetical protein
LKSINEKQNPTNASKNKAAEDKPRSVHEYACPLLLHMNNTGTKIDKGSIKSNEEAGLDVKLMVMLPFFSV